MASYTLKKRLRTGDVTYAKGDSVDLTDEAAANLAEKGYIDLPGAGQAKPAESKADRRKRAKELVRQNVHPEEESDESAESNDSEVGDEQEPAPPAQPEQSQPAKGKSGKRPINADQV